jgi:hypothetical protein
MVVRLGKFLAITGLIGVLTGCSTPASQANEGASVPGSGQGGVENPADGAAKEANVAGSKGTGTTREQYFPILERAHSRMTWPPLYTITADEIWVRFMGPAAGDNLYSESDAADMVQIWNICAWTLQLADDVKAGRPIETDSIALKGLRKGGFEKVIDSMLNDASLGDIAKANQFVAANDCKKGFNR